MHSKNLIHRDIKPENFLMGLNENSHILYLIDYGLASLYKDSAIGAHIPFKTHLSMVGTARYASINTHLGIEQSRRDDLESIGYLVIYLLNGCLPWQGEKEGTKKEKYKKILEKKLNITPSSLCSEKMRNI